MGAEDIISAWKSDEDDEGDKKGEKAPPNPAGGLELTDEELEQAAGGVETCSIAGTKGGPDM
jgi:mersacidin/lichenicidin family type 2 lantibiotic